MLAKEIAALVSMPKLLGELGFPVNERSHRCRCILHDGKNPSSFSWTDKGEWYCFTQCGGGDRISLVMAARRCNFQIALTFLAALAGVNFDNSSKFKQELARARSERRRKEFEQVRLKAVERREFLQASDRVLALEGLRRNAARRLAEMNDARGRERFPGEKEFAWTALAFVASQIPRAAAAYTVIAFSDSERRLGFAMHPEHRAVLVDDCLEIGGVYDDKNHFVGIVF